jgi:hypothetical protein
MPAEPAIMSERFVTIGRFSAFTEAQAAKTELEAANVPAWIIDDSVGGSLPGLGDSVGAITLQVHEGDYDRAEAVLSRLLGDGEGDDEVDEASAWTCTSCGEEVNEDFDTCPACGTARAAVQTRPPSPAPPSAAEGENELATPVERTAGRVVQSRPLRAVVVALLAGPGLVAMAVGAVVFILWLLAGVLGLR